MKPKTLIGRTAKASFPAEGIRGVPVKIDTGAHSSSIWASELEVDDAGVLHFVLFAKGSPFYSGKRHSTSRYDVRLVRSSNGTAQVRYRVTLQIVLAKRRVKGAFTLSDRSSNMYPILIGCRLLRGKFLVDASKGDPIVSVDAAGQYALKEEFDKDPRAFYQKYHMNNMRGDVL